MHSSLDKNSAHHLFPNHKPSRPRTLGFAEFHAAHFPPHLPFFRNLINPQRGGFYPQYSLPSEYTHHVDTYSYPQNNIDNEQYEELATQEETEDVEEVNFQLSEETIAMFAFSEKHRLERDAEKSLEAEAQRKEEGEALTVALNSLPTMTSNSYTP
ncbi:hypothetical protein K7432_010542 [Basidiobolus ranarum]|uniref:Uncharacterized protein n=1 Tax=Basidiobolus ranarum TaxID=34480 RepID=A0ABR2VVA4_9FUNG